MKYLYLIKNDIIYDFINHCILAANWSDVSRVIL